ncbi:MAG: DUF6702 family protein [Flavobacteriaceae bacterium]
MRSTLILMFCAFLLSSSTSHKYYVSTTEIEYKVEQNRLQITLQLFIDDAELMLQQIDPNLRLDPDFDSDKVNFLLGSELTKVLTFSADNNDLDLSFLGKEYKNDIMKCYIEADLFEETQELKISNTIFFTLFDEQQNIIHFKGPQGRKSFLLHSKSSSIKIQL